MRIRDRCRPRFSAGQALACAGLVLLCGCQRPPAKAGGSAPEPAAVRALRQFIDNQSQAAQIAGAQARSDQKLEDAQRAAAAISAANRDAINQELGRRAQAEQRAAAVAAARPRAPEPGAAAAPPSGDLSEFTFPKVPKGP